MASSRSPDILTNDNIDDNRQIPVMVQCWIEDQGDNISPEFDQTTALAYLRSLKLAEQYAEWRDLLREANFIQVSANSGELGYEDDNQGFHCFPQLAEIVAAILDNLAYYIAKQAEGYEALSLVPGKMSLADVYKWTERFLKKRLGQDFTVCDYNNLDAAPRMLDYNVSRTIQSKEDCPPWLLSLRKTTFGALAPAAYRETPGPIPGDEGRFLVKLDDAVEALAGTGVSAALLEEVYLMFVQKLATNAQAPDRYNLVIAAGNKTLEDSHPQVTFADDCQASSSTAIQPGPPSLITECIPTSNLVALDCIQTVIRIPLSS
ncbi:MAG: hypothetical protein HY817_02540 [Candidatus Abawacabacteria bacterium]|nr:hypothetical protein [Candidatus Abawacabacteria bacterium]